MMRVQPYLFFDGRCEEALEFYRKTLGAEITALMRFKENPEPDSCAPGMDLQALAEKVMHGSFRLGDTEVLVSDGNAQNTMTFQGFSLTISVPEIDRAERLFAALGEGGQVQMPMTPTFFAKRFGMVADKFGVSWMVLATDEK